MTGTESETSGFFFSGDERFITSEFLDHIDPEMKAFFSGDMSLRNFLKIDSRLNLEQCRLIVEQALITLEGNYVHLPLKKSRYAVDPVRRLKLLQSRLERFPDDSQQNNMEFHREMSEIFLSVRDLHTKYLLPEPFKGKTAYLPFMVEDYKENGERKYLVSNILPGFSHPTFVKGVQILYWNGMPIERAVWNIAPRFAGSNQEARHARAVATLTTRVLTFSPPPDEEWVILNYFCSNEKWREIRFEWKVNPNFDQEAGIRSNGGGIEQSAALGIDFEQSIIQATRKVLFAPHILATEKKAIKRRSNTQPDEYWRSEFSSVFEAKPVETSIGTYGYIRIRTFKLWPPEDFIQEFFRLIRLLPQKGLIIDVRNNGGGYIMNGERILQLLTPRHIEPESLQFINTPLNLKICRHNGPESLVNFHPWVESMEQAQYTGAVFSAGFPISSIDECNDIGQKYFGPVVLIIDALCYSTTDFFAAGFQDHKIGPILGADGATGAGGGNVWQHQKLKNLLPEAISPYKTLPNGADLFVALRRSTRVAEKSGIPVEDIGVIPDERHDMTKNDILNGNVDLIEKAASLLNVLPFFVFSVKIEKKIDSTAYLAITTESITRLDVYLDNHPSFSLNLNTSDQGLIITKVEIGLGQVEFHGFNGENLVVKYREKIF